MSRFQISDIQSASLLFSTDSLDEAFDFVQGLIRADGLESLEGLLLSHVEEDLGRAEEYENQDILHLLQSRKAKEWTEVKG